MASPVAMDIRSFLSSQRAIQLPGSPTRANAIATIADLTATASEITDKDRFVRAIFEREEVTSTGIGGGVAVPHACLGSVRDFVITLASCPGGIHDFPTPDRKPVNLIVMIAASDRDRTAYLRVLASVAARLKDIRLCQSLVYAPTPAEMILQFTGPG